MKTLVFANQKGGVGKTAVATQFSFFLRRVGHRVLVIDLDHQGNCSTVLKIQSASRTYYASSTVPISASAILRGELLGLVPSFEAEFVLVSADSALSELEQAPARFSSYVASLEKFLNSVADRFDVCIVDTNPNPDIRVLTALLLANYVVSPVQMNQEAIDGLARLLNHPRYGVNVIRAKLNPGLRFLGLLPNLVDVSRFQRSNLEQVVMQTKHLFVPIDDARPAFIPYRSSIAEAQSLGLPLWELGRTRTAARDTWKNEVKPSFEAIAHLMELSYAT